MLDETLNKISKMIEVRGPHSAMLEKDQRIQIQNEELSEVSTLTYEEISIRSQNLSIEIEIRNEKRQALRKRMADLYEEADEDRRSELRKYSIVPQSIREDAGPNPVKKKYNLTPEEKREKRIDSTMKMFNLTREKAIKYIDNFDED